jgi:AcrR family transcriptional regulator
MVRKPKEASGESAPRDTKGRIVDALMALAAERDFDAISIAEIAAKAGVTLADFREAFPSKGAVLAAFSRDIDLMVLRGTSDDLREQPAKDRLFDVLMRRLDALGPHKAALDNIMRWARRDPLAMAALNGVALNSMRFMLEAADLSSEDGAAALKLQGLVFAWLRVLGVWQRDEESGLGRTMAALDREIGRGAMLAARLDDLHRLAAPFRNLCEGLRDARRDLRDGFRRRERWRRGDERDAEARA